MTELTLEAMQRDCEKLIRNPDIRKWNQSYFFNFYDRHTGCGAFIRMGFLENLGESNCWAIFFRDGKPLFLRSNMNLPYTEDRPDPGVTLAGITFKVEKPLQSCRVTIAHEDFSADLVWDQLFELCDSIHVGKDEKSDDDAIGRELSFYHPEGVCSVKGTLRLKNGETVAIDTTGWRDISAGPRNWSGLHHYRLVWPIFDNGMACVAVHGITDHGHSYQKILHDGVRWMAIDRMEEDIEYYEDGVRFKSGHWKIWDETGRLWEFTGKPMFHWHYPFDTFMMVEQMMEFRLADGTLGYGMAEGGFNFPWRGNGN